MGTVHPSVAALHFPKNFDDLSIPFKVDEQIRRLMDAKGRQTGLAGRFSATGWDELRMIGRETLRVAFNAATFEQDARALPGVIEEWRMVSGNANDCLAAFERLLRTLGPTEPNFADARMFAPPLRRPIIAAQPSVTFGALGEEALRRAAVLLEARHIIQGFAAHAAETARDLSASRTNPGELEKAAFTKWIAVGWVFLTDRPPGRGVTVEGNPFLRFLLAIWSDLSGEASSFESALDRLDRDELKAEADAMERRWRDSNSPF